MSARNITFVMLWYKYYGRNLHFRRKVFVFLDKICVFRGIIALQKQDGKARN